MGKKTKAPQTSEGLVQELQCPGCASGSNLDCGAYRKGEHGQCVGHSCGTLMTGAGQIALGFPKGFCRPGVTFDKPSRYSPIQTARMQTWDTPSGVKLEVWTDYHGFDKFNVPVAKAEWSGKLVIVVHSPRTNRLATTVLDKRLEGDEAKALVSAREFKLTDILSPEGPSREREVKIDFKRPFAVRFWTKGERPVYTDSTPTWALKHDGLVFVRVCRPETAETWVDVVTDAKRSEIAPNAVDVGEFHDEID